MRPHPHMLENTAVLIRYLREGRRDHGSPGARATADAKEARDPRPLARRASLEASRGIATIAPHLSPQKKKRKVCRYTWLEIRRHRIGNTNGHPRVRRPENLQHRHLETGSRPTNAEEGYFRTTARRLGQHAYHPSSHTFLSVQRSHAFLNCDHTRFLLFLRGEGRPEPLTPEVRGPCGLRTNAMVPGQGGHVK